MILTGAIDRAIYYEDNLPELRDGGIEKLGEIEQQFQIVITGSAVPTIAWTEVEIIFDILFVNAENQRYSNLTLPQFTSGVVLPAETTPAPVLVTSVVRNWLIDPSEFIRGAVVALGACAPGATSGQAFSGHAHLSFQGYGSVADDPAPDLS